jgi:PRTRC genetic system protein A
MLVDYHIATKPITVIPKHSYDYVLAGNGVFLRAVRAGIDVLMQIASCEVRGLPQLDTHFYWKYPRVPVGLTARILQKCKKLGAIEVLFYLLYQPSTGWQLVCPEQEQSTTHCRPLYDDSDSAYARAIVHVHSHHQMAAQFSEADDQEDQGFRIYGIIGNLGQQATLIVRVGVFGYFWNLPAALIFELPDDLSCGVSDAETQ